MRYASLRNSSAVSVDGRRDSGGGMVLDAFFSVRRVLRAGVRSVIVSMVHEWCWSRERCVAVNIRTSRAVGPFRLPDKTVLHSSNYELQSTAKSMNMFMERQYGHAGTHIVPEFILTSISYSSGRSTKREGGRAVRRQLDLDCLY